MKKIIKPVLFTGMISSLLISAGLFYVDATVKLPQNKPGNQHIEISLDTVSLGTTVTSIADINKSVISSESLPCKDLEPLLEKTPNARWYELKTNSKLQGVEKTIVGLSSGKVGAVCLQGTLPEESKSKYLTKIANEISPKFTANELPGGGKFVTIGEEIKYERHYETIGRYLSSLRHELISELDSDKKHYDFKKATIVDHPNDLFTISLVDHGIFPYLSEEERSDRLDKMESAFEKFEKKFIGHQLDNSWTMRSGLIMKLYLMTGTISEEQ